MKTLILDSATNILYTCLIENEQVLYESYVPGKNDHAKALLVEVEKACEAAHTDLKALDQVIVGYGPGSYTGVRMAVTVGKMIATLESQIKLYTISTLLLIGSGVGSKVLSCIDARRGNCFGCIYDFSTNEYCVKEALYSKEELLKNEYDGLATEEQFKVDPFTVLKHCQLVSEPRLLKPNYLRETEAERNLHAEAL